MIRKFMIEKENGKKNEIEVFHYNCTNKLECLEFIGKYGYLSARDSIIIGNIDKAKYEIGKDTEAYIVTGRDKGIYIPLTIDWFNMVIKDNPCISEIKEENND